MPDHVDAQRLASALGRKRLQVSAAEGRDSDSVWVLGPRAIRVGRIRIVPAGAEAEPGALQLLDTKAFGTGLHPTTALCLAILDETVQAGGPSSLLDVGTGSGVLALAALSLGVAEATGIDVDEAALRAAAENARINGFNDRLRLAPGGPEVITGTWPLVLANVLAAPLIEMAPALVQRVAHHGEVVLSGIPAGLEEDVSRTYRRLGMHRMTVKSRDGWVALVFRASW
ncbi:MAG TPA: 50S ribosomal protein L11 methyltransferase [Vicinamibacterales bacterium]|nr:50S ribosomal protein L11 methyltransferase [Vicinamibacterales bacterium]